MHQHANRGERSASRTMLLVAGLVMGLVLPPGGLAQHAALERGTHRTFEVPLHKSRIIQTSAPVSAVSVGNPEVADILILQTKQVYVVGKSLGSTNVVLWDGRDQVIATLDVEVTHDLDTLKQKLHELLSSEAVEVRSASGVIVLSGEISSAVKMDAALKLASSYSPEGKVLNLMQVGGAQQVMLEVKVAEVARTLLKRLDINFNLVHPGSRVVFGAVSGGARFPDALFGDNEQRIPIFSNNNPIGPVIDEFAPNDLDITDNGFFASFLNDELLFNSVIDAAKEHGLAKVLAEPTLTTMTGQEAQFLSGGEFPIPVPGDNNEVTIQFKEFGVGLKFLPVVLDSGRISLKINVKVSELSAANSVILGVTGSQSQFIIPSLTSRSANSTLELNNGQTMAIAGLISDSLREQVNKFPGLGDIPLLGLLFRSQEFQKNQTELVIFVTPRFARPIPQELVRLPTDAFVEPSDLEFYLLGRMEGRAAPGSTQPTEGLKGGGAEGRFGHDL